tara:strand:+ start:883 stop:1062 length:180 start_codon:yes stop_codon:yes gene_type:complete
MVGINVLAEYLECTEKEVFEDAYAVSFNGENVPEIVEEAYRDYVKTGQCPIWVLNYLCG